MHLFLPAGLVVGSGAVQKYFRRHEDLGIGSHEAPGKTMGA